jgi:hypothetical protein
MQRSTVALPIPSRLSSRLQLIPCQCFSDTLRRNGLVDRLRCRIPGNLRQKTALAIPATELAILQFQQNMPHTPTFLAQPAQPTIALPPVLPAAFWTLHQTLITRLGP